jgi:putative membrane protein
MVQHLLLAQVFPPLFVLGMPGWLRRALLRPPVVGAVWDALTRVPVGFVLYTVVFSIWHVPVLYNLMMRDHGFHILMHLMVMATATMMWWPVVGGSALRRPIAPGAQMLYLFLLGTPMMAVAALIVFAQRPLYEWYLLAPRFMGMTAIDDQRLGALIMWIPGGLFWWIVMSVVFFRWSVQDGRPDEQLAPHTA